MPISDKRKLLKEIQKQCTIFSKDYLKRYKKMKKIDDTIDVITSLLSASSIGLIVSGLSMPPLLLAAVVTSSLSFVITQVQLKYDLKTRYNNYNVCVNQYDEISREIITVLYRNHMTIDEYENFIDDVQAKLSMIDDSRKL